MATTAGQVTAVSLVGGRRRKVVVGGSWSIANGGVATLIDVDDPQIVLTRTGAGIYTLTYPASFGIAHIDDMLLDTGTANIVGIRVTAQSATAGTATLNTLVAAGTAADNTSAGLTLRLILTLDIS